LKRILFVIVILASVVMSQAQTFDYPIRVVNGQEVYEYPVQKSEGLYRISVNFGVTQEELIKFNPELKTTGLKEKSGSTERLGAAVSETRHRGSRES